MVRSCCVRNCSNASTSRRLFAIPAVIKGKGKQTEEMTTRRRREWIAQLQLKNVTFESTSRREVCSDHFVSGKPAYLFDVNCPNWKPTLKLGHTASAAKSADPSRFERHTKRMQNKMGHVSVLVQAGPACEINVQEAGDLYEDHDENGNLSKSTQTDVKISGLTAEEEKNFRDELNRLKVENSRLKEELRKKNMNVESLAENDDTVRYFTGISSFLTLTAVLDFVLPHLPSDKRRAIPPFQSFLLTLMHMRLNTPLQHLAFIFGVSRVTATKIFHVTLGILYQRLSPLVFWPEKHIIKMSLPKQFLSYPWNRVVSIIDCFEVFVQRSSSPTASAQTWSNYKHNNTIKYLISITPQGYISFVSKGWGGRASDKHVTQNCGYIENLRPNDLVLADRGFDIADIVGRVGAEVKIPAFTRGKSHLSAFDIESTRTLAMLRIHVERVIGVLFSKFSILNSVMPIELLYKLENQEMTTLDMIVCVGCALVNVCDGIM